MTPGVGKIDLSDIDIRHLRTGDKLECMEDSNKSKLDNFLDSGLTGERLEMLLDNSHRLELIDQINDSVSGDVLGIISLSNQVKLQNQRDNAADLIRITDLFKKLLSDASIIKRSESKLRIKSEELGKELTSLLSKYSELEKSSKKESEGYKLFKSEYEETISKLSSDLEKEKVISSELMEENLVSKINAQKIQDTYKNRLKHKKTISLEEFLDSKEGVELIKKRVLDQTVIDKRKISTLEKKVEKLATRVINVEDTNSIYKILNGQLNGEFDKMTKFVEELVASSPTNEQVQELKAKISSLIIEKSDLVLRLGESEKDVSDRVETVEDTVEDLKKKMEEMEKSHELALKAKDDEISKIRRSNNIGIAPHIKKQAHEAYNENDLDKNA